MVTIIQSLLKTTHTSPNPQTQTPKHSGREFTNACRARCAGLENFNPGPCAGNNAAATSAPGAAPKPPQCACPSIWRPVCASADDGRTYQTFVNACAAKCAGATVKTQGECATRVVNDEDMDGVEDLKVAGSTPAKSGKGPDETPKAVPLVLPAVCPCPRSYIPVCGTVSADGQRQQFANACEAKCKGAKKIQEGPCSAPAEAALAAAAAAPTSPARLASTSAAEPASSVCSCPRFFRRVCGKDGYTYNNDCMAKCAGTEVASQGACQGELVVCSYVWGFQ